ncbi:MAG TPA: copper resistance CopC family protein [Chondromyces sp.]|nr:copper resistance CopC family protein [Chondromyces sp.]
MKKVLYVLFLFLFAFSTSVSAHTGLEKSSPSNGQTITEDIQEITLEFDTTIEKGSSFTLLSEGEKEIPVQDIQINGATLTGRTNEPLGDGNYTVKWNIIGEDGHLINEEYVFTVAKGNNNEPAKEPEEENTPSPSVDEQTEEQEQPSSTENNMEAEKQSNASFMPVLIGLLLLVGIIMAIWLMRKGKK